MWVNGCYTYVPMRLPVLLLALAATALAPLVGCGGSTDSSPDNSDADFKSDPCHAKAISAAENEYGNSPDGTSVKVLTKGTKYRVTVGLHNEEDGPHDYYVVFPSGCSSSPKVSEVPSLPHPLRDAVHAAYGKILSDNKNEMPASYGVAASALPNAARKQLDTWTANGHSTCSAVNGFKVTAGGQATFGVQCVVPQDSIKFDIAIYDSTGKDIDQAAIYHTNDVGDHGVSWQNETFLQED